MAYVPSTENGVAFGFMPAEVVETLLDIGNWRRRASAMDAFHSHLQQQISAAGIPPSQLPSLLAFIYRLIKDPNFKICISAMNELITIINASPLLPQQHANDCTPLLVERLCDSKLILRQHAHKVFQTMIAKLGPDATLAALAKCIGHFAPRAREEIVNVHIAALLSQPSYPFEWAALVNTMLTLMDDPKERVRRAAQEAMCVVSDRIPKSRLDNIFMALRAGENERNHVAARAMLPARPQLAADGSVQHCMELEGSRQCSGSGTAPPPTPPSGSFRHLPFQVPSPGQFSRGSLSGGAAIGWPVEGGGLAASPVARPKRSQPASLRSEETLPLSYFHGPTATDLPSTTAATIHLQPITSRQSAALDVNGQALSDGPRQWHVPVTRTGAASPEMCKRTSALEALLPAPGNTQTDREETNSPPLHKFQGSHRVEGFSTSRCMLSGDSELSDVLFKPQEQPLSPPSLTAVSHTKHLAHGRMPMRSTSHVQSAPSSEVVLGDNTEPVSPSKAVRLESLKRRQAERRAQSAGTIPLPPERPAPRLVPRVGCEVTLPVVDLECQGSPGKLDLAARLTKAPSALDSPSRARGRQLGSRLPRPGQRAVSVDCATVSRSNSCFADPGTPAGAAPAAADFDVGATMPSAAPEQDLAQCLEQLALANAVKRKELDWVAHQEAVNKMRQLLHHHADVVMASTKDVISAMLPCTAALRSSTAKVALLFFQEMFKKAGQRLSSELDEVTLCLLRKAGEMSTAGRDNFLGQYADVALSQMVLSCPEASVAKALMAMMKTSSQPIRLKVAGHLDELLSKCSTSLFKSTTMQSQLFRTAAALLEDGSIETRIHAKRLIFALKRFLPPTTMATLQRQRSNAVQEARVAATLELLGPPEAPQRLVQSFAAVMGCHAAAAYAQQIRAKLPSGTGAAQTAEQHPRGSGNMLASRDSNALMGTGSGSLSGFSCAASGKGRTPPSGAPRAGAKWNLWEGSVRAQSGTIRAHESGRACRVLGTKPAGGWISCGVGPVRVRKRVNLMASRRDCDVGDYVAC